MLAFKMETRIQYYDRIYRICGGKNSTQARLSLSLRISVFLFKPSFHWCSMIISTEAGTSGSFGP
jgi:hypothetical protein